MAGPALLAVTPFTIPDIQDTYEAGSTPIIELESSPGTFIVRDNATPLGTDLFSIQTNAPANIFAVTATGVVLAVDLDMGTQAITNVGDVDGRDVSADGSTLDTHVGDSSIHFTEGSIDHGNLDGPSLLDDDHTQYLLIDGTRAMTTILPFDDLTSSSPALNHNGTTLEVRLADDSALTDLNADTYIVGDTTFNYNSWLDFENLYSATPLTDRAANPFLLKAGNAYAPAATNVTGGDLEIAAGIGRKRFTVTANANCPNDLVSIWIDGVETVLTEGVDWTAGGLSSITATSLAAAVDALTGVSAAAAGTVVQVTPDLKTRGVRVGPVVDSLGGAVGVAANNQADGTIYIDSPINLNQSAMVPPTFGSYNPIVHNPEIYNVGTAVAGYFVINDDATVYISGVYNSYGVINCTANVTSMSTSQLEAVYLFVNVMDNTATAGSNPATIHSFDHKARCYADNVNLSATPMPESVGFNDWATVETIGTGQFVLDKWITVSCRPLPTFYYRLKSSGAGSLCRVNERIGFYMEDLEFDGGGGTEEVLEQYGLRCTQFQNPTTLACPVWIGGATGATENFGIVIAQDGGSGKANGGGGIWFGAGEDATIFYNSTNLVIDPDVVGSGKVLIGTSGDNDLQCLNLTVGGNLEMTGGADNWLQVPQMTTAERNTMVSSWGAPDAGKEWFNTTTSQGEAWDGSTIVVRY